jgi:hypothetical protein
MEMEVIYPRSMTVAMIAPCGMNCALCLAHLREKKPCPGCHGSDINKPNHCVVCKIKNCEHLGASKPAYCFECGQGSCRRLKQLDKRYRTKYGISMLENLEKIGKLGLQRFIEGEKQRWRCQNCGGTICVHKENCLFCGHLRSGYETNHSL